MAENPLTGGGETPINNALSNYDNTVEETETGKSGFVSNLLSGGLSLSSLSGKLSGLSSALTGKVGSFLSDGITKLNELASGLLGKIPGLNGVLGKLGGFLNKYLESGTNFLKNLLNDTLKQLENATLNFINNIVEDFMTNLLSSIYIPDEVFCKTIQGLYYSGADLAYDDHYIRKSALSRDWSYTLEFVDEQYGVDYDYTYVRLNEDLNTCASNCCVKNLVYIFDKMVSHINDYKIEIVNKTCEANAIKDLNPDSYQSNQEYIGLKNAIDELNNVVFEMEEMIVSNFKKLIVNSNTYLSVSLLEKFFTGNLKDYILPKYFGMTDDKFNKKYVFSESDCRVMMPTFTQHEETTSDKFYLDNVNSSVESLQENAADAQHNYEMKLTSGLEKISDGNDKNDLSATVDLVRSGLEKYRSNMNNKQQDRYGVLANSAVSGGRNAVYNARTKYSKQNDLASSVKYRKDITGAVGELGKNLLYNDTEYITLKNKHIKNIYIYLSTQFGDDNMVNEEFYLRCKIPTMNTLMSSVDKMQGIIGSSMVIQSLFDVQNDIDKTAYEYTKKVESFLFDPSRNIEFSEYSLGALTFQVDPSTGEIVFDSEKAEEQKQFEIDHSISGSSKASNQETVSQMDKTMDTYPELKQEVSEVIKYTSNIPMITMRDTIIKWSTYFYNFMIKKSVRDENISYAFSNYCKYVFAVKNITDPNSLSKIFDKSTKESLIENIKVISYIIKSNIVNKVLELDNNSEKDVISNLFFLSMNMFISEISNIGFIKSLYLYDKEYLRTYLKSLFYNELDYLRSINDKSKESYKLFYPYKDLLTTVLTGFDKRGILGYNENVDKIQYTNIEIGDWKCIKTTNSGTFFGGSDNTKNNGIRILNSDGDSIISTNITDGTWVDIFEYLGQTFFLKDTNELYYWTGSKVESTKLMDFDKWEIYNIKEFNLLLLLGKNNNGVKYWVNNQFNTVASVTTGDNYRVQKCNIGYIIYPTGNVGVPILVNSSKVFKTISYTDAFTYVVDTTKDINISATFTTSDSQNSEGKLVTISKSINYLIVGTKSSGLKFYKSEEGINDIQEYSVPSFINKEGFAIPNTVSPNIIYYITADGEYKLEFDNKLDKDLGTQEDPSGTGTITLDPSDEDLTIIENTKTKTFNLIKSYNITPENFLLYEYDESTGNHKNYNKNILSNTIYDFDSDVDIINGYGFKYEPNDTVYWKFNNNKGLYKINNDSFYPLFENIDNAKDGWNLFYVNDKLFASCSNHSVGVRVFDGTKFVSAGLTDGYWIIDGTKNHYFALSTNGTNQGIKYCSTKALSIQFVDIPRENLTNGDFSGIFYDKIRNKIFFGSERSNLILNIDSIQYDIDEYMYPLNEYMLQQKISIIMSEKLNQYAEFIMNAIEEGKDLFVLSSMLLEKIYNLSVDGKTLREVIYELPDDIKKKIDSFNNPLDLAQFLIDKSSLYRTLVPYIPLLQAFLHDNANFVDIFGMLLDTNEFMSNMEKASSLYTELTTRALAKNEFDIDNKDAINDLLINFMNSGKYSGDIETYYNRMAHYRGMNIKYYGLYNYDKDGNQITLDKDSKEYKRLYVADSDEFMNSDEEQTYS